MTISGSVLLYHNGNKKVISQSIKKFCFHQFRGNWADNCDKPCDHSLYEMCIADATDQNLYQARSLGIKIYRWLSSYDDDCAESVTELALQDYHSWLDHVICKNLCFADIIDGSIGPLLLDTSVKDHSVIITTGRTANTHLQLARTDIDLKEGSKCIDDLFLTAAQALLLWRLDQWECVSSQWIMHDICPIHQYDGSLTVQPRHTAPMQISWIESDWKNFGLKILDLSLFFRYVLGRHISHMTTEDVISRFRSKSQKIDYKKSELIPNYQEMKHYYRNSWVENLLTMCYHNTLTHLI